MSVAIANVIDWLGGPKLFRSPVKSELELAKIVGKGLPIGSISAMVQRGALEQDEVERYIIPKRTLAYRRKHHQALSTEESDRLARTARIVALAAEVFRDDEKAARWMRKHNRALGGEIPLELIATSNGARLVEDVLQRIVHGVFS